MLSWVAWEKAECSTELKALCLFVSFNIDNGDLCEMIGGEMFFCHHVSVATPHIMVLSIIYSSSRGTGEGEGS